VSDEGAAILLHTVREGETESRGKQLFDVGTADVLSLLDLNDPEDVDRAEASTVPGSHILIEALDSVGTRKLSEFLVHVMCTRPGVVTDPDAEVLDLQGLLFVNAIDTNDLAVCFFDLLQLSQEVPEAGFSDDLVQCKNAHTVNLGVRLRLCGQVTTNDLVLRDGHVGNELS